MPGASSGSSGSGGYYKILIDGTEYAGLFEKIERSWRNEGASAIFYVKGAEEGMLGKHVVIQVLTGADTYSPIFIGEIIKLMGKQGIYTKVQATSYLSRLRNKVISYTTTSDTNDCGVYGSLMELALDGEDTTKVNYGTYSRCTYEAIGIPEGTKFEGTLGFLLDKLSAMTGKSVTPIYSGTTEYLRWQGIEDATSSIDWTQNADFILKEAKVNLGGIINKVTVRRKWTDKALDEFTDVDPNDGLTLTHDDIDLGSIEVYWAEPQGDGSTKWVQLCKYEDYEVEGNQITITASDVLGVNPTSFRVHYKYKGKADYTASDSTSQTNYGIREALVEVEGISADTAQDIADAIIRERKDPSRTYDIMVLLSGGYFNLSGWIGAKIRLNIGGNSYDLVVQREYWSKGMRHLEVGDEKPEISIIVGRIRRQIHLGSIGVASSMGGYVAGRYYTT